MTGHAGELKARICGRGVLLHMFLAFKGRKCFLLPKFAEFHWVFKESGWKPDVGSSVDRTALRTQTLLRRKKMKAVLKETKRIMAVLLSVAMIFAYVPSTVSAFGATGDEEPTA